MLARSNCSTMRPNTLMQHLTFVVSEVCLATRGRAIHCGTKLRKFAVQRFRPLLGVQRKCVAQLSFVCP